MKAQGHAEGLPTLLTAFDTILNGPMERVEEHASGIFKGDAVLPLVAWFFASSHSKRTAIIANI